jgi:mRNA degradation ribonuclease J1/J2
MRWAICACASSRLRTRSPTRWVSLSRLPTASWSLPATSSSTTSTASLPKLKKKSLHYFKDKKVLFLAADSTNVEKPGFSIPERVVKKNMDEIIANTPGRLIIGTFSSQLERLMRIVEQAERVGRKVLVEGRSMKVNLEIVKHLGCSR